MGVQCWVWPEVQWAYTVAFDPQWLIKQFLHMRCTEESLITLKSSSTLTKLHVKFQNRAADQRWPNNLSAVCHLHKLLVATTLNIIIVSDVLVNKTGGDDGDVVFIINVWVGCTQGFILCCHHFFYIFFYHFIYIILCFMYFIILYSMCFMFKSVCVLFHLTSRRCCFHRQHRSYSNIKEVQVRL